MKKSKYLLPFIALPIFASSLSAEIYIVKHKDTLSKIIKKKFSDEKIYGSGGMLEKILFLNPKIKNPNRILVNQRIRLPEIKKEQVAKVADDKTFTNKETTSFEQPSATVPSPIPKQLPSTRVISNDQLQSDNWTLKVLYGIKFLSLDQSKTLTGLNLSTISTDHLKFESEFKYDNYKFIGSFESHSFSYASANLSHETKLSTFEMSSVWNNYLIGLSFKETPLLKATTTSLDLTKEAQIGLMLGYDKMWILPTTKPTSINLRSTITIPFSASSDKTDTTISSLKGFELKSNMELSRVIFKREDYSLNFVWQNELMYGQTSRNINWGTNSGKVDLTKIEAKSLVGLGFSF